MSAQLAGGVLVTPDPKLAHRSRTGCLGVGGSPRWASVPLDFSVSEVTEIVGYK